MANKKSMDKNVYSLCENKISIWIMLIVGILYLLKDLNLTDITYGIQWYTVAYILLGLAVIKK